MKCSEVGLLLNGLSLIWCKLITLTRRLPNTFRRMSVRPKLMQHASNFPDRVDIQFLQRIATSLCWRWQSWMEMYTYIDPRPCMGSRRCCSFVALRALLQGTWWIRRKRDGNSIHYLSRNWSKKQSSTVFSIILPSIQLCIAETNDICCSAGAEAYWRENEGVSS